MSAQCCSFQLSSGGPCFGRPGSEEVPLNAGSDMPTSTGDAAGEALARVLVVDDDVAACDLVAKLLRRSRCDALALTDGHAALEEIGRGEVDVLVTDLTMPGMDGIELLERVKRLAPDTEVVLITAEPTLDRAVQGLRRGAADLPETIAGVARRVLDADDVSVMLADPHGALHVAFSNTPDETAREAMCLTPISARIAGQIAARHEPALIVGDPGADPRFEGVRGHGRAVSSIVYPLVSGRRVLGVLNLNRAAGRVSFVPQDVQRAGVVAGQVVLALENARLVERAAAAERLAAIGQMAAGLAHEISSPATCVLGHISLVQERLERLAGPMGQAGPPGAKSVDEVISSVRASVSEVAAGAQHLIEIVDSMRELSANRDGDRRVVQLGASARSALRIASYELHMRGARAEVDLAEDAPVLGRPGRLSQVLLNLLVNAAHAVADVPASQRWVRLHVRREEDEVVAEVADGGVGIAPEHQARLFEAFFTTKPEGVGTGLGLAICAEIVHEHGGTITCESGPGEGARFRVRLPAAVPQG
jgi:signal transduction histidine kinase/CheY-like chemotaxis protein